MMNLTREDAINFAGLINSLKAYTGFSAEQKTQIRQNAPKSTLALLDLAESIMH